MMGDNERQTCKLIWGGIFISVLLYLLIFTDFLDCFDALGGTS